MKNRFASKPRRKGKVRSLFDLSEWGARQPWRAEEPVTLRVAVQGTRFSGPGSHGRGGRRKAA